MKPLIITGCQRSGTAYTATVLTAAGLWCGHEREIGETYRGGPVRPTVVEASWMAVPHLAALDAHVVHQVRHPLRVAASMLARRTLGGRKVAPSGRYAIRHCPRIADEPDEPARVLRYWHDWNLAAEAVAGARWRLCDLDVGRITAVLEAAGRRIDRDRLAAALDLVPRDVNAQPGVRRLSWGDLPDGPAKADARRLARRYGW